MTFIEFIVSAFYSLNMEYQGVKFLSKFKKGDVEK